MKNPIPDLSNPSPIRILLRERREQSIAEGNSLIEQMKKSDELLMLVGGKLEIVSQRDFMAKAQEFAEIERQMG